MLRSSFAALCMAAVVVVPATAAAESIVYVRSGDVYLTAPQGTLRITTDGGYESPSQSDDGTIVAVRQVKVERDGTERDVRLIHRFDRTGRLLNAPTEAVPVNNSRYVGPLGMSVSFDGTIAAYHYFNYTGLVPRQELPRLSMAYTDRDTPREEIVEAGWYLNPTWVAPRTVAIFGTGGFIPNVQLYTVGEGEFVDWFSDPNGVTLGSGDLSRDGARFAATAEGASEIRLYSMAAPPPAMPTPTCTISKPGATYQSPSWSPDSKELAWSEEDGLHIAAIPSITDCAAIQEALAAPGAESPDFGPAGLPQASAPAVKVSARAVFATISCARACKLSAKLVKAGRTVSTARKRLTGAGTARLRLAKNGRTGKATLSVTVNGKTTKRAVRL